MKRVVLFCCCRSSHCPNPASIGGETDCPDGETNFALATIRASIRPAVQARMTKLGQAPRRRLIQATTDRRGQGRQRRQTSSWTQRARRHAVPIILVANSAEGTVSKIDTRTMARSRALLHPSRRQR